MKSNIIEFQQKTNPTSKQTFQAVCDCLNVRVINPKGNIKPSLVLDLRINDTKVDVVKFLPIEITPKGYYKVNHDSDFAKLFRLTTGKNPVAKYSNIRKIWNQFIEYEFNIEYEIENSGSNKEYLKATSINPVNPVLTDEWSITGKLAKKRRTRATKTKYSEGNEKVIIGKDNGNYKDIIGKDLGNDKSLQTTEHKAYSDFESHLSIIPYPNNTYALPEIKNIDSNIYAREDENNSGDEEMSYEEFCRYHMIDDACYVDEDDEEFEEYPVYEKDDIYAQYKANAIIPF
jgi:hypothetical protein